jgi:dihydropyrimidine dehydrogenase (NAD+) subunit PreT
MHYWVNDHWSLFFLWGPAVLLGTTLLFLLRRWMEVLEQTRNYHELRNARKRGSHKARLQYPEIDLSQCIGCGTCIQACPEEGVLELIHGQAVVVHGARCVGHGQCAAACPTGGIALTLGDLNDRNDIPALEEDFEAVGLPGLFVAGELSGFALVKTAVTHGVTVANAVAKRVESSVSVPRARSTASTYQSTSLAVQEEPQLDLVIVGSGPAGLSCSLRARELGLNFITLEQEQRLGGTVASYPRKKMVMTQPVHLPLVGKLPRLTYLKEELVELWNQSAQRNNLPIVTGVSLTDLSRDPEGCYRIVTATETYVANNVCLALGRRGTPRKLGVPGEDLPHVAYGLLDAESYKNQRILVVGGGDSAIEAAVGLSNQTGNTVTLAYRKKYFFRLKARNEAAIQKAETTGKVRVLYECEPTSIEKEQVHLKISAEDSPGELVLECHHVFILAGGTPPFSLLEKVGVSFDSKDRPVAEQTVEKGSGLLTSIGLAFLSVAMMIAWVTFYRDYYALSADHRVMSPMYEQLRPSGPIGLSFGVTAVALMGWNLMYLLRRSPRLGRVLPGTLKFWMTSHVFTGIFALLCVFLHAGFLYKKTVGGHAFIALCVVIVTGSIGRYLYAFVPRMTNGAEMNLDDLQARLAALSGEWDKDGRGFGSDLRRQVEEQVTSARWRAGLFSRIVAVIAGQINLQVQMRRLGKAGVAEGIPLNDVNHLLQITRKVYWLTFQVAHFEEIRAVLSSWRYFHRWLALLMVLLAAAHIATAIQYGSIDWSTFAHWPGKSGQ